MRLNILTLLTLMTLCSFPMLANAATYNWYFSDDAAGNAAGNDTTGDGSQSKPWKTLAKAQSQIKSLGFGDTVNLYFDRGDTWEYDSAALGTSNYGLIIDSGNPTVHIDAYGSGNKPNFDGRVADFSTVPAHNASNGPAQWTAFFVVKRSDCTFQNIAITNVYGNGIRQAEDSNGGVRTQVSNCDFSGIGTHGINFETSPPYIVEDILIEYNTVHTAQQLQRFGKGNGWGGAISAHVTDTDVTDSIIRYNLVYDVMGEGIISHDSTIEYNVVGSTGSYGIDTAAFFRDVNTTIVRYNFIISEDWSTGAYDTEMSSSRPAGFRVFDETKGGTNANADYQFYGNITINRAYGIRLFTSDYGNAERGNIFGSVKIYNNLFIDSHYANIGITNPQDFDLVYIYNNAFILYDQTGTPHTQELYNYTGNPGVTDSGTGGFPCTGRGGDWAYCNGAVWTIKNNAFWTTGGSPKVDTDWRANYIITDPKLPGEPSIDWDGQSGSTYYRDIDFDTHLYLSSNSSLIDSGKSLGAGYNEYFLTVGSDFGDLPHRSVFRKISQNNDGNWEIGITVHGFNAASIPPPSALKILN